MRLRRIGTKLVLAMAAILAVQVAVRSYVEVLSDAESLRATFLSTGRTQARALAEAAEYGLLARDTAELEQLAESHRPPGGGEMLYAAFYDEAGRLLAYRNWSGRVGLIPAEIEPAVAATVDRGEIAGPNGPVPGVAEVGDTFYRFTVPVAVTREMLGGMPGTLEAAEADAPPAGERAAVVLARSYEGVNDQIAADQREVLLVSGAVFFCGLLVVLAFSRRLVQPIHRLVEETERVAAGDLAARVDVGGRVDELGALARSFNRMTERLAAQRDKILGYSHELEERVEERTVRLKKTNLELEREARQRERTQEALQEANRRLEQLATTDELTDLCNRRQFLEILDREMQRRRRQDTDVALMMIDVDHFKTINDTHGHLFGDLVLKEVAKTLRRGARGTDVTARYAGDEFVVLMPDTDSEAAFNVAQRVRSGLKARTISDGTHSVTVNLSVGIASAEGADETDGETLIRLADEALYAAKGAGRDCVRSWGQVCHDEDQAERQDAEVSAERIEGRVDGLADQLKARFVEGLHGLLDELSEAEPWAREHARHVAAYARRIAEQMDLEADQAAAVGRAALIHDLGKAVVPAAMLRTPGPLTDDDRKVVEGHALAGGRLLEHVQFLKDEARIVRHHHERWDGEGYPDGLSGLAIPLGARILAVADAFDAMTSDRPHRGARDVAAALRELIEGSGTRYDPRAVDALLVWVRDVRRAAGADCDVTPDDLLAPVSHT